MDSMDVVVVSDVYRIPVFQANDNIQELPFEKISGEYGLFRSAISSGILVMTNYRLHFSRNNEIVEADCPLSYQDLHHQSPYINIPLPIIETLEIKDTVALYIYCKDVRTFCCVFRNSDDTMMWHRHLMSKLHDKLDDCFAFWYLAFSRHDNKSHLVFQSEQNVKSLGRIEENAFNIEMDRLGFNDDHNWRISEINKEYKFCSTYPKFLVVPNKISDEELQRASLYRSSERIPAVVWRHQQNGCVIARSSQPRMGILNWWRSEDDEKLIDSFLDLSIMNDPNEERKSNKKLLIIDARSFSAAVSNRAKGGGYECEQYYPRCEVQYMGIANIHTIRSSFVALRALCATPGDPNWLSLLEKTCWLQHISSILRSALIAADAIAIEERPVLVHCSDGWDRTPQIVSLAKIMLDSFYRTKKGFRILVEREWLEFGHKFGDRCDHPDNKASPNEKSPVFLQWLDCVYQLLHQYPCHFEFNKHYLARLALYTYSCLFGTFLLNTDASRHEQSIPSRAFSAWPILQNTNQFHNFLFNSSTEIIRPSFHISNLALWKEVYLFNSSAKPPSPQEDNPPNPNSPKQSNLVKTKSCDDIQKSEDDHSTSLQRRKSDPSIVESTSFSDLYLPSNVETEAEECKGDSSRLNLENVVVDGGGDGGGGMVVKMSVSGTKLERGGINGNGNGSTDTLVSETLQLHSPTSKSITTDTDDLALSFADLLQLLHKRVADQELTDWLEHKRNQLSPASTPNQSHTPSSGFPETPSDEAGSSSDVELGRARVLRCDGMDLAEDPVQEMLAKIISSYKRKCEHLDKEIRKARVELFEHMIGRQCQYKTDSDDPIGDSASSCDNRADSVNSESSWENL